ncbi:hypothetical protein CL614_01135 [archaeon]|nr:hypothetical protein [archaeon]|tara:strand:+ start:1675 stop:2004 length:330 start_codon:yes stop_codon:yes gene_type:complete
MKYIKLILLDGEDHVFVFREQGKLVLPYTPSPNRNKHAGVAEKYARDLGFDNVSLQPAGQDEHKDDYFAARVDRINNPDYEWIDPDTISNAVDMVAIDMTKRNIPKQTQ